MSALFARVTPKPRSLPGASSEGLLLDLHSIGHRPAPLALAANRQVRQVTAGAAFIQPKLPPASVIVPMNESVPFDVVDMPEWAGLDEASGHNVQAFK